MTELNNKRFTRQGRDIPKTQIPQGTKSIDVYTYRDALNFAHEVGLVSIKSDLITELCFAGHYVAKATVTFSDGSSFDGIGDADDANVNKLIAKHLPRMAETRAVGRALGKALNLDANFADEMGGDDADTDSTVTYSKPAPKPAASKPIQFPSKIPVNAPPPNDGHGGYECESCHEAILDSKTYTAGKKAEMSAKQHGGQILCWNCTH